jgi:hypothetical protein
VRHPATAVFNAVLNVEPLVETIVGFFTTNAIAAKRMMAPKMSSTDPVLNNSSLPLYGPPETIGIVPGIVFFVRGTFVGTGTVQGIEAGAGTVPVTTPGTDRVAVPLDADGDGTLLESPLRAFWIALSPPLVKLPSTVKMAKGPAMLGAKSAINDRNKPSTAVPQTRR